jgi:hypothetical protein
MNTTLGIDYKCRYLNSISPHAKSIALRWSLENSILPVAPGYSDVGVLSI